MESFNRRNGDAHTLSLVIPVCFRQESDFVSSRSPPNSCGDDKFVKSHTGFGGTRKRQKIGEKINIIQVVSVFVISPKKRPFICQKIARDNAINLL